MPQRLTRLIGLQAIDMFKERAKPVHSPQNSPNPGIYERKVPLVHVFVAGVAIYFIANSDLPQRSVVAP